MGYAYLRIKENFIASAGPLLTCCTPGGASEVLGISISKIIRSHERPRQYSCAKNWEPSEWTSAVLTISVIARSVAAECAADAGL